MTVFSGSNFSFTGFYQNYKVRVTRMPITIADITACQFDIFIPVCLCIQSAQGGTLWVLCVSICVGVWFMIYLLKYLELAICACDYFCIFCGEQWALFACALVLLSVVH